MNENIILKFESQKGNFIVVDFSRIESCIIIDDVETTILFKDSAESFVYVGEPINIFTLTNNDAKNIVECHSNTKRYFVEQSILQKYFDDSKNCLIAFLEINGVDVKNKNLFILKLKNV